VTADARSPESADRLRADLVTALTERGSIRSPEVAAAFAKVPRERFAPEAPLVPAYSAWDVVVTKRDPDGKATSSRAWTPQGVN
jgi:protein-L-isoaspartate(D-aspartate) O-methyltransferase